MRLSELASTEVLLLDDGHCFRDHALPLCSRAQGAEASLRATCLGTLSQMGIGGAAVTPLPALAVPPENRRGAAGAHPGIAPVFRKRSPRLPALRGIAQTLREAYPSS